MQEPFNKEILTMRNHIPILDATSC